MNEDSRPIKSMFNSITATSVGRFYEKRHQFNGALDQYNKALSFNPEDTATYINRSRVLLKMGSIDKAQEDTDSALNLIGDFPRNPTLLLYYVCLQKAEVLYANGEFELALMYFHRANRIKPGQTICLEGIDKSTEILQCTICNSNLHLTMTKNFIDTQDKSTEQISLLNRPPIRKPIPPVEQVLTKYTNEDANRLLNEVGKDRQVLIDLVMDEQSSAGFTGLNRAQHAAHQSISILESQLRFLEQSQCIDHQQQQQEKSSRNDFSCTSHIDRSTLIRIAEEELISLEKLFSSQATVEILYRAMKIINCLQTFNEENHSSFDLRTRLMLAEAYRFVARSYDQMKCFEQSNEYYQCVCDILQPLKNPHCLYRAMFDLARNFLSANKYSQAIEKFLDIFQHATTDHERALICQYLSLCYLNSNQYDQAKKYAYEALDYAMVSNNELLSMEVNILLGKIYLQLKDFQRAEEYMKYAQNLKDQLGDLTEREDFQGILSEVSKHSTETNISPWRILTPYHQLVDICLENSPNKTLKF